jgi:signal transduction histidine kinase/DNA-binding LytR/AlgR family response regulator
MQSQKPNWTANISSAFLFLSLLSVTIVGGVSFFHAREALKEAAFKQLNVAAALKEQEIVRWFEERERDFLILIQSPDAQAHLKILLRSKSDTTDYQTAYAHLIHYFEQVATLKPSFKQIALLTRSNRIILSTNRRLVGKYVITTNLTYFEGVEPGDSFNPILYRSSVTNKPAITYAAPIRDSAGRRQGVILADLNFEGIVKVVGKQSGLGKTGETYLVGSLVNQNTFISREQLSLPTKQQQIHSQGIDHAIQGKSGAGLYRNYANVPILGVYRWLNNQNLALFAEVSQSEAFHPARLLAATIIAVGLISTASLFVGVRWLTRQLKASQTQLKTYSEQLEKKAQEAEMANQAKSEFLANMSHELRTPLNAILGFAKIMTRDAMITSAQLEHLSIISRSGAHLLDLINDVLSMAKIEAGRTTLSPSSFDLYQLLESLAEMLGIKAQAKGLVLRVERSPDVPRYIQTDEHKLRQVLINLLGNAIKFTETGQVSLNIRTMGPSTKLPVSISPSVALLPREWLDFEVKDTGVGISPLELNHLFDPFFQTAKTQKSSQGSGLGLAISQDFINLLGGKISVRQTSPQGSTFGFTIQVTPVTSVDIQAKSPSRRITHLAPNQPNYRILIVEDSWENRRLLVKLLTSIGFEIQEAENGQIGIEIWSSWQPHLIWMDMRMPLLDGYAATRQIRQSEAELRFQGRSAQPTKIIALTASVFEEERAAILAAGCDDLVQKPLQEEILFERMAHHLGVTYQYAEALTEAPVPLDLMDYPPLAPDHFSVMSQDWITALHQAALQVDASIIFQLVEQIPPSHASLARQLKDLTSRFCFDEIMELTQQSLH